MSQDYSEVYLLIKAKLALYHSLTLQGRFNEATDIAIELADLTIKLEQSTMEYVPQS
jgi:hypothetical protein